MTANRLLASVAWVPLLAAVAVGQSYTAPPPPKTVTTAAGHYTFEHPVLAEVQGDRLRLNGKNRGEGWFPLADIAGAEVKTRDVARTAALYSLGVVALAGVAIAIAGLLALGEPVLNQIAAT